MKNNIKQFIANIPYYLISIPSFIFHELCHIIVISICLYFGVIFDLKIKSAYLKAHPFKPISYCFLINYSFVDKINTHFVVLIAQSAPTIGYWITLSLLWFNFDKTSSVLHLITLCYFTYGGLINYIMSIGSFFMSREDKVGFEKSKRSIIQKLREVYSNNSKYSYITE